jgi:hypothetical protein
MQKIPTLFQRHEKKHQFVIDVVTPGCEWVIAGEGVPTRKYDGMCCMVRGGKLYKRFTAEHHGGKVKTHPQFESATEIDPITHKQEGWVPVGDGPEDQYFREAFESGNALQPFVDGTYELLGPKVQGNPEHFDAHTLLPHANAACIPDAPRTFAGLKAWFVGKDIEGLVFRHPDGRLAKIKGRDFGYKRTTSTG